LRGVTAHCATPDPALALAGARIMETDQVPSRAGLPLDLQLRPGMERPQLRIGLIRPTAAVVTLIKDQNGRSERWVGGNRRGWNIESRGVSRLGYVALHADLGLRRARPGYVARRAGLDLCRVQQGWIGDGFGKRVCAARGDGSRRREVQDDAWKVDTNGNCPHGNCP